MWYDRIEAVTITEENTELIAKAFDRHDVISAKLENSKVIIIRTERGPVVGMPGDLIGFDKRDGKVRLINILPLDIKKLAEAPAKNLLAIKKMQATKSKAEERVA